MNTLDRVEPLRDYEVASFNDAGIPDTLAASFPEPVQIDRVFQGYNEQGVEGMCVAISVGSNGDSVREELWFHDPEGSNPWGLTHPQVCLLGRAARIFARRVDLRPRPPLPETTEPSVWIG